MNTQKYAGYISPVVLVIVVGMYGYWAVQRDLVSSRPATPAALDVPDPFPTPGLHTFHSRMWEDPLAQSYTHWKQLPVSERLARVRLVQDESLATDTGRESLHQAVRNAVGQADQAVGNPDSRAPPAGDTNTRSDREATLASLVPGADVETRTQEMKQLLRDLVAEGGGETLCLPVFVPGGPYAEDRERRTRIRYAVVTALAESGYHLKYDRRMSYAVPRIYIRVLWGWQEREIVVPIKLYRYENLERPDDRKPQLLVLWINENELGVRPLLALHRILHELFEDFSPVVQQDKKPEQQQQTDRRKFKLAIIGPASSGTLQWMSSEVEDLERARAVYQDRHSLNELLPERSRPEKNGDNAADASPSEERWVHWFVSSYVSDVDSSNVLDVEPIRGFLPLLSTWRTADARDTQTADSDKPEPDDRLIIFSPRATRDFREHYQDDARKNALRFVGGDSADGDSSESDTNTDNSIDLVRVIGTDRDLAEALLEELRVRGATGRIVLITEHDTAYGRAIPHTFEMARQSVNRRSGDALFEPFTVFRVLRGIDGNVPGDNGDGGDSSRTRAAGGQSSVSELPEIVERPPAGRSQYDYLRRLRPRVEEFDDIAAIGVVGSDIYDKLLVLRALKPHCPDCVIFTTDLDAIYAHPDERPQTHNLLIASHFGLSLDKELQQQTPPFRDSYQTATFLATRLALHNGDPDWRNLMQRFERTGWKENVNGLPAGTGSAVYSEPAVYVVGRNQMHLLSRFPAADPDPETTPVGRLFHPNLAQGRSAWHYLTPLALVLVAGALAWSWFHRDRFGAAWLRAEATAGWVNRRISLLIGLGVVLCVVFLVRGIFGAESAAVFDAYSTWPTKLLYSVIGIVALLSVIFLTGEFRKRTGEMRENGFPAWPVFGECQQIKFVLLSLVFVSFLIVCISPHPHLDEADWTDIALWIAALCVPFGILGVAWRSHRDAARRDNRKWAGNLVLGDELAASLRCTGYALSALVVVCVLAALGESLIERSDVGWHPVTASRDPASRIGDWMAMVYGFGTVATLLSAFVYLHFWCLEFGNGAGRDSAAPRDEYQQAGVRADLEDDAEGKAVMQAEFRNDANRQQPETADVAAVEDHNRKWDNDCARLRAIGNLTSITGRLAPLLMALLLVLVMGYHPWLSPVHMPASLLVLTTLSGVVFVVSTLSLRRHFARDREAVQSKFDLDLLELRDRLDALSAAGDPERDGVRGQRELDRGREPQGGAEPHEGGAEAEAQPAGTAQQTEQRQQDDPVVRRRQRETRRLKALAAILERKKAQLAGLSNGVFRPWSESPMGWILGGGTMLALVDLWVRWWSIGV